MIHMDRQPVQIACLINISKSNNLIILHCKRRFVKFIASSNFDCIKSETVQQSLKTRDGISRLSKGKEVKYIVNHRFTSDYESYILYIYGSNIFTLFVKIL